MDKDEMKAIWDHENKLIADRAVVNHARLASVSRTSAVDTFDAFLTLSMLGRYLALVYALISLFYCLVLWRDYLYSLPLLVSSGAMVWSFFVHRSLRKPDYGSLSLVKLQEAISAFRVHTERMKFYDFGIVAFWLITLAPAYFLYNRNIEIYGNGKYLQLFAGISAGVLIVMFVVTLPMYSAYRKMLGNSVETLDKIKEFQSVPLE